MNNNYSRNIARVCLIYIILSALWILLSDYILNNIITDKHILTTYQTYKGLLFITISGLLMLFLIRKLVKISLFECAGDLRRITDNMMGIIVETNVQGVLEYASPSVYSILGYIQKDILGKSVFDFIHPEDQEQTLTTLLAVNKTGEPGRVDCRCRKADGEYLWIEAVVNPFNKKPGVLSLVVVCLDITQRKQMERELTLQRVYFQQLFDNSPNGIVMMDNSERIVSINKGFEKLFQYKDDEASGQNINNLVVPEHLLEDGIAFSNRIITEGLANQRDTVRKKKDGSLVNVNLLGYPIIINNKQVGLYVIYSDITDRKKTEDKLKYLSMSDSLTGLYNRGYFEQEMTNLQHDKDSMIGIIMCDLDGLKLINDTMGHDAGDTLLRSAAKILKNYFRETDIVARIGGDEFAVLLPGSTKPVVEKAIQRVKYSVKKYNEENIKLPLSLSVGFAQGQSKNIEELFKEADNGMYREKLHHSQSTRSAIVQTLVKAMEARDYITEGHGDRLQDLVENLAMKLVLPERVMSDLRLFAQFHDVGKVGIPDRILFKKGPLTPEETQEMKRHSEIGHRIAHSAPDLVPIADWILKHHEWWNGKGYPLGLKGEEIPLECRILAIVDAYDAMTNDRPYRKAMPWEKAVKELQKCAGEQFDPMLVNIFIQILGHCDTALPNEL